MNDGDQPWDRRARERFSSTSSSEEFITDSSEESSSTTETSSSDSSSENESQETRRTAYETRNSARRGSERRSSVSVSVSYRSSNGDISYESENDRSSEEEARDDLDLTAMENHDDGSDVQILENNEEERPDSGQGGSDPNEVEGLNLPKRRRTDGSAGNNVPEEGVSTIATTSGSTACAASACEDDADDGCSICYEEYTNAGEHRLASVKCGHFFGYSCIARWIRSEGRNAVCPTCKTKTSVRDIRKHYPASVKVTDTTEVEMLRNSNAALHIRISGLEVELARKDREIADLMQKLRDSSGGALPTQTNDCLTVIPKGGRIFMNPERKDALAVGNTNADARAMDFNGECWAVGVACAQARNIFSPFGIRMLTISRNEFKLRECYPLHSGRSRVVVFSPFESSLLLSGGEDKRAVISENGAVRRQYKMPHEKPVWTGCWTARNKVAVGLGDGRVYEYDLDSDSTEPVRDYTQGVGHLPIIFTGFDTASSTLLVASFKKLVTFRNDKVFPLLCSIGDNFDKMRSISFDESTSHFAVTFSPGGRHPGISHRLYRLLIDDDNDEVQCIEMGQWLTDCQMSSTMWSNCLFSLQNSLFSVVYNEDERRFDAHDWSGRRNNALVRFPSSSTVAAIRAVPSSCDKKTIVVLADKAIFTIAFSVE